MKNFWPLPLQPTGKLEIARRVSLLELEPVITRSNWFRS